MRLITALLAAVLSVTAPPGSQSRPAPFLPVAVWYVAPEPRSGMTELDAGRRDLAIIRSLGFNSIRTRVDWPDAEPVPGRYELAALRQVLALAGEAGLRVIVEVHADAAPPWLGTRYPDARYVPVEAGASTPPTPPGFCFDHRGVAAAVDAFIAAVSTSAAAHPSFYAIDVRSEPYIAEVPTASDVRPPFCRCAHTTARFEAWTRGRSGRVPADAHDRAVFEAVKLSENLKRKVEASAPRGTRAVTSHADMPSILLSPLSSTDTHDDWWMATAVEHHGTSIDLAAGRTPAAAVRMVAALDGMRSAARERGWWLASMSSGGDLASASGPRLRLWSWTSLARGARSFSYDIVSGRAPAGSARLVDAAGMPTPSAKAAGEFAGNLTRNAALFEAVRPRPSQVAILYSPFASAPVAGTIPPDARASRLGIYRALFERNIQVDFIHPDEVLRGLAARYRAVYLPAPLAVPEVIAGMLKVFVREGGTLISEARPAWQDERRRPSARVPGFGLDEVFGARETGWRQGTASVVADANLADALAPIAGRTFPGMAAAEYLQVTTPAARVLARFAGDANPVSGNAAIVESRYGKGRAILIGGFPSASFEQDPVAMRQTGELLQHLVSSAGVAPDVGVTGAPGLVEARFLESPQALLFIAVNHSDTAQTATLTFTPDTPEAIWQNMENGASVHFVQGASGPFYRHTFGPHDVVVLVRGKRLR